MIRILKASAGSGKTYNLAREYIRLLLVRTDPQAYRHILALTFTNKATEEMKGRILKELFTLSDKPQKSPYLKDFVPALFPTEGALKKRASDQLNAILHDYSAFAVSTIDRFFQQALRAFSREIGQFASYQVDLDKEGLVNESVDHILDSLTEEDRTMLDWLTESVKSGLERGVRFNLEQPLKTLALRLRSEDYDAGIRRFGIDEDAVFDRDHLRELRKACEAVIRTFLRDVSVSANAVLEVLDRHCVAPADSKSGFLKALYGYVEPDPHAVLKPVTPTFREKAMNSSNWFAKAKDKLRVELEGELEEPLEAFCGLFDERFKLYRTALVLRNQVYSLGIAAELKRTFAELQKEKNVISIEDSNKILKDIIDGSDAPFIYEKLGVRYEHFLLDEFQDTSSVQWDNFQPLLSNSLSGGFDDLIVGDVKQSIYRWRGSDWHLLESGLQRAFEIKPDGTRVLEGNFRTCREIVSFNNDFFLFAAEKLDAFLGGNELRRIYRDVVQTVRFDDPAPGSVDIRFVEDTEAEMDAVLEGIREVGERGGKPGDIAILVRNNEDGSAIASRLVSNGIPVVSDDSLFVKSSITVRRLSSQLSLAAATGRDDILDVAGYLARKMDLHVPDHYHSLTDLAESLLRELREADPDTFEAEIPYVQSFLDYLLDWTSVHGNDLSAFLQDWEEASPKIASPDTGSSVRVITVHKSKGLEFPYVIFPFAEKVTLYKSSTYWCRPELAGTELEATADGIYPVELSASMEETLFADSYLRERELQAIDNINVFYVALTRAKYGLRVIAKTPSQKLKAAIDKGTDAEWKDLSQLLYAFVQGEEDHRRGQMYDFHGLKRDAGSAEPLEMHWPSYPAGERGRLRFSRDAADFFGPDGLVGPQASNRLRGLVLHDILSSVIVPEDLSRAVERAVAAGELPEEDRTPTLRFLSSRIASAAARDWFPAGEAQVLNEASLIGADGAELRPDRVILHDDGSVTVVDYKFGRPEKAHLEQVRRYVALYRDMGHATVEGFLWYVEADEVVSV